MKVLVPQTIGADELIATNADDPPATWNPATTYSVSDLVSTNMGAKHWEAKYGTISGALCLHGLTLQSTQIEITATSTAQTAYTKTGVDIGAASANRLVIVAGVRAHITGTSSELGISSATIGGVTATINAKTATGGANDGVDNFIASAIVPSGTTATITVYTASSAGTTNSRMYLEVYVLYNGSATATDSTSGFMLDTETDSITPNSGDVIIGIGVSHENYPSSFSVTDCSTDSTKSINSRYYRAVSGTAASGAAKTIAISGWVTGYYNGYSVASFTLGPRDQVNLNKTPGVDKTLTLSCFPAASLDDDWWVEIFSDTGGGVTNEYRMFSELIGEQTRNTTSIVVELLPSQFGNALALFNLDAISVQVETYNPSGTRVYNETKTLAYTDALYSQITSGNKLVFDDILDYDPDDYASYTGDGPIKVTILNTGGVAACGGCVFGEAVDIGGALYGTEVGIEDYSRKEFDTFGRAYIIERDYADNARYEIAVQTDEIGQIKRFLASLRASPAVYIGDADIDESVVYGFYSGLEIPIEEYGVSVATLDVTGLV